jgi:hypothetical protein
MDPRIPFVILTVGGAISGTTGGAMSMVKTVAWLGMLSLVVADARWRQRQTH